jgi:uncharacterized protein YecE (DUF72 family)
VYPDWNGVFYPPDVPAAERLAYYAARFDAVEINSTHYRLASAAAAARWQEALPARFHAVAKGSAFITHRLKLRGCEAPLARFFAPLAPLTSLRAVLWQLPARFPRDLERVDRFLSILPRTFGGRRLRHALEPRDPWWWSDETKALLASHDVAFCAVSHRELPPDVVATGDLVYVRFHGLGEQKYVWDYSSKELRAWADRLRPHVGRRDVYAFFNNDFHGHALHDAETFRSLLGAPRAPRPSVRRRSTDEAPRRGGNREPANRVAKVRRP